MKNNKFWLAGIIGTVVYFLLGWLIYGLLLMKYMEAHSGLTAELHAQVFKPDTQMNWAAIIISNLLWGYLVALVLMWGNFNSLGGGAKAGFIIGLLICASIDLSYFSMSNLFTTESMIADIVAGAVMTAIGGAVIGMILGKGTTAAA